MTLPELVQMLGGHSRTAEPPPDPDHHQWLHELDEVLVDIRDCRTDLVTLYL